MANIVVMKLVTGEEVIADRSPEQVNNGAIYMKPRTFSIVQDAGGNVRAGLIPWIMADPDAEVMLINQHIIAEIAATSEIETAYLQQTTGLTIPKKSSLIV